MNRLIFDYNNTFIARYNCSFYDVNIVLPVETRRSLAHGTALLIMGVVFIVLYMPCLYAMTRRRLITNSCYRLMLTMAILDVLELSFTAVYSGVATIMGLHYCDTKTDGIRILMYIQGCFVLGLWFAYTYTSLILALNRCLSFGSYKRIFDHPVWLAGTVLVLFLTVWFVNPLFYHSFNGVWLFTPHPLELTIVDRDDYHTLIHSFNNFTLALTLPIIYMSFFLTRPRVAGNSRFANFARRDISLLIQSMLVTGSVALCAGSYACLELFDLSAELTKAAHILWIVVEGAPSVVYLTLNQTILCILCARKKSRSIQTSSTQYAVTQGRKTNVTPAIEVITSSPM